MTATRSAAVTPARTDDLYSGDLGYIAQTERPAHVAAIALGALDTLGRVLVATDGTVTNVLEAYHLEPVKVRLLAPQWEPPAHLLSWVTEGASAATLRCVALTGAMTGLTYGVAASLLTPSEDAASFGERLLTSSKGIGDALRSSRTESRRELLWYGVAASEPLFALASQREKLESGRAPAAGYLTRAYRIVVRGSAVAVIQETFALPLASV